jgi:two-component system cell cycle response regulator
MAETTILAAVEDELLLRTVAWFLRENGYRVLEAPRADAMFEHLASAVPDLLLLDTTGVGLPGPRLLEWLKGDEQWRDMPVVILAAMPPDEETVRMLSLGAADYVGKPFRVRELLARIQVQLRIQQLLRDARAELRSATEELRRARSEAAHQRELVDIIHEVTGELSPDEIYHILVRRVARALNITHCSLVLARPGDEVGRVATAYESPAVRNLEIRLDRWPEIRAALERGEAVVVEDVATDSLYREVREAWARDGGGVNIRSVAALPFELDRRQAGVFLLRTTREEMPLTRADVEFADAVIKAAVSAVRKAEILETTRADKERLEQLASTDALTQTLNRRALMDRLSAEMDRARRYEHSLALLMIDLDHFKSVNDTYGHLVGDDVLREVGQFLVRDVRTVDIVARYGGEEFVILLPEQGEEGAVAIAERLRQRIAEVPFVRTAGGDGLRLTVSIGVAIFPSLDVAAPDDLLESADEALYRAKANGRNLVCR